MDFQTYLRLGSASIEVLMQKIIDALFQCNAVRFGDFILKSKEHSPIFIDIAKIFGTPVFNLVTEQMINILDFCSFVKKQDSLCGAAYKGIPLAVGMSYLYLQKNNVPLPVFFDRKEPKKHGEIGRFFGLEPTPNANVVIIDDVISDGLTKSLLIDEITAAYNVNVSGIIVVVDRRKTRSLRLGNTPVYSLVDIDQIIDYMDSINHPKLEAVQKYFKEKSENPLKE